ncbi:transcriptional regulator TACO1-like protein [Gymnopilus junonius]|uniref:Transcriptional regulator TACO1-like protein n=1 Tax=Gymnopilus junonius TaxID=109634 RepID=A0A9P5TFI7_GYMJU|nr:transcriptional regulator TACO1-like protein [Gymnopilus junonius]
MFQLLLRPSRPLLQLALSRSFFTQSPRLSGHNKWSKIKDKKGANDAQKSALYTKINREIAVAVKTGGSVDPEKNIQLVTVLKKAKELGVPKDNVEKALANCVKGKDQTGEKLVYEALAYKAVGVVIECVTDNTNRTIHNVREVLTSHGAHMTPVNFMFSRRGCVTVSLDDPAEQLDGLMGFAIQSGALDVDEAPEAEDASELESIFQLFCEPQSLAALEDAVENAPSDLKITIKSAEVAYMPNERFPSVEDDVKKGVKDLKEDLEAIDDVSRVWTSLD